MSGQSGRPELSGYNYRAVSSLVVLTADRSQILRRDKEPDGAPTSLAGHIDPREMGSRVQREQPKDVDRKKKKVTERQASKQKADTAGFGYTDIIEATQDVEGLTYRPRTAQSRQVYELILASVHQALGDQTYDIVRSAADTVLESLKNENIKISIRKRTSKMY